MAGVSQMVPQRCPDDIGTATGIIGTAGGLGGLLPLLMGSSRQWLNRFDPVLVGMLGFVAAGLLLQVA